MNELDNTGDEIFVATDDDSGTTYVFRGRKTYKIVDGKEVLVEEDGEKIKSKDTSDRSRK